MEINICHAGGERRLAGFKPSELRISKIDKNTRVSRGMILHIGRVFSSLPTEGYDVSIGVASPVTLPKP